MPAIPLHERLIVALDVPDIDAARALVATLGDTVCFYKIGMQLQFGGGLSFVRELIDAGKKVFLDAKLFDIDETIERAVANVAAMGVDFLTVHGNRRTIPAAVKGRGNSSLKIFAVTVLTSLDSEDMADIYGEGADVAAFVQKRAENALAFGADGVIASAHEATLIKALAADKIKVIDGSVEAPDFRVITPGIRPAGESAGDQKRVMTPARAIAAGADYLVVGRPIYQAPHPKAAAQAILDEIGAAH